MDLVASAAIGGVYTLTSNLFSHYARKLKKNESHNLSNSAVPATDSAQSSNSALPPIPSPRNNLFYDQVFVSVREFFVRASNNTIESLQAVGNAYLPTPVSIRRVVVVIDDLATSEAQAIMVKTIPDLDKLVGGSTWWAERGVPLKGEWIMTKKDLNEAVTNDKKARKMEEDIEAKNWRDRSAKLDGINIEPVTEEVEGQYTSELDETR